MLITTSDDCVFGDFNESHASACKTIPTEKFWPKNSIDKCKLGALY
jgi:hypothetical protein